MLHLEIILKLDGQGQKIESTGHFESLGDTTWWHEVGNNIKYSEYES